LVTVVAGRTFLAVLFSAAVLSAACGGTSTGQDDEPDCVVVCEKGKAKGCDGTSALKCDDHCLREDVVAENSGCRDAYTQTLTCSSNLEDICSVLSSCRTELIRYQDCIEEYCSEHEADFCP
jgi:hypothetical protein